MIFTISYFLQSFSLGKLFSSTFNFVISTFLLYLVISIFYCRAGAPWARVFPFLFLLSCCLHLTHFFSILLTLLDYFQAVPDVIIYPYNELSPFIPLCSIRVSNKTHFNLPYFCLGILLFKKCLNFFYFFFYFSISQKFG